MAFDACGIYQQKPRSSFPQQIMNSEWAPQNLPTQAINTKPQEKSLRTQIAWIYTFLPNSQQQKKIER